MLYKEKQEASPESFVFKLDVTKFFLSPLRWSNYVVRQSLHMHVYTYLSRRKRLHVHLGARGEFEN